MNKEFEDFCHRHHLKILDTNKRFARYRPSYNYFSDPKDYNVISSMAQMETEPLYTIEIPLSELTRIKEFEEQVFGNMKEMGHYGLFQNLMDQKEEEARIRRENPGVQKAYENYSLMLNLCKGGKTNGS